MSNEAGGPPGPGWYPADASRPEELRYWDGQAWGPVAPSPQGPAPQIVVIERPGTNGMSVASMVLGIIWIYWIGSILAVIFGHVALSQLAKPENKQGGRGMAIAGLVLGYIGVTILALIIIVAVAANA